MSSTTRPPTAPKQSKSNDKIQVCIRIRPTNERENKSQLVQKYAWRSSEKTIYQLHPVTGQVDSSSPCYTFDSIFDATSSTEQVYEVMARDIVVSAVDGYNGTIFAYGQTSSGKTHTMKGCTESPGIITRSITDIFKKISECTSREFLVRVSYLEIYNENIMDLLQPSNENLKIHEDLQRGIFVGNVREECVCSVQQAIDLLEQGEVHRHFGATGMNDKSSRSHTIFRLTIESREMMTEEELSQGQQGAVRIATLNLVDLAGSERVSHTKAEGVRLFEGGHINKSLLTLGTVISKLADGKRDVHIPYRDSKLTRILQTALGGNSRTAIICTVTPAPIHSEETHFTLKFANRAKNITNDAHINEILNDKVLIGRMKKETDEWKDKCRELEAYVEKLENEREKWAQEFCEQHDQKWKTHCQSLEVQIVKSVEAELDVRFSAELERRIQRIEEDYRRQQELNMQEQLLQYQRREAEFEEQKRAQLQQEQEWESQRQTMLVQHDTLREQIQQLQTEVQQVEEEYQTRISELEQDKDQIMIDHSTTYEEITKLQAELQKQKKENMDLKIRYGRRIARDKETERSPLQKIDLNAQEIKSPRT